MAAEGSYGQLSATDLSTIILKGPPMSTNDRDTGFYSGSSEAGDELSSMDHHSRLEPHSPTDASEDSVEVKVTPITLTRNKRKSTEPSRVICEQETGPLKKRIRYVPGQHQQQQQPHPHQQQCQESSYNKQETEAKNHFRPWDVHQHDETIPSHQEFASVILNPAEVLVRHPGVTTLHRSLPFDSLENLSETQDEPLALIAKKPSANDIGYSSNSLTTARRDDLNNCNDLQQGDISVRVQSSAASSSGLSSVSLAQNPSGSGIGQRPQQRNYKNMTRERRIEANARERTRVHTISAAYDTLRKSIPAYSNTQKLSKLSVLRIACSYILTLSRMAGEDYSADQTSPSIADCMDIVTKTIQTEGKIRKKKDE